MRGQDGVGWPLWRDVVRLEQKVLALEQRMDALDAASVETCALCEARLTVKMLRSDPVHGRVSYLRRVPYCEFCETAAAIER